MRPTGNFSKPKSSAIYNGQKIGNVTGYTDSAFLKHQSTQDQSFRDVASRDLRATPQSMNFSLDS